MGSYLMGNFFPIKEFVTPKREIQFESDFIIKAGHRATSRYFGTSLEPIDLPIEMTFTRDEIPKLKLIETGNNH